MGEIPMLRKIPDERLQSLLSEALTHPVERRAQVVHQLLAREGTADLAGQLARLGDVGIARLHPQEVGVGGELAGALGGGRETRLVVVEAFAGARAVAGPDDGRLRVVVGEDAAARDGQIAVLLDVFLVGVAGGLRGALCFEVGVDGWGSISMAGSTWIQSLRTFVERDELVLLDPVELKGVDLRGGSALPLHGLQGLREWLHLLGDTEDELVVARVNGAADQLSAFRVRTGDDQVLGSHQVPLEAGGHQAVDVFAHGDKDLAGQVTALLATVELVLEVDGGGTVLGEELGQLQDGGESTVSTDSRQH